MMSIKQADLLEVGVITGTHGLRGDLKIRTLPTGDLALPGARTVYLMDGKGLPARYDAIRSSPHKQYIVLRLSGLENVNAVQGLIGSSVWMAKSDLPDLEEDQFFWSDLEGLDVVDQKQGEIGKIVGMFSTPAHDILEVDGSAGEVLVPAVEPFLVELDLDSKTLYVNLPEGLIAESDEE